MSARLTSRSLATLGHDVVMAGVAFLLSLFIRLGNRIFEYSDQVVIGGTALFVVTSAVFFWFYRLDASIWRYAAIHDVVRIAKAAALANLVFLVTLFLINRLEAFPRSTVIINTFVLTALLAGPRLLYRIFKERHIHAVFERDTAMRVPVLLIGAGDEAELFMREMARSRSAPYRVVGLIDDRERRIGRVIRDVEVMGTIDELPEVCARLERAGERPQRVIVTSERIDGARMRALVEQCDRLALTLARMPRLTDFQAQQGDRIEVRPIAVEDLLGRPQAVLDRESVANMVRGRRVLITGAGGTIGGELTRQIAALGPSRLIMVDKSEFLLWQIDLEIGERHPGLDRHAVLGDVSDRVSVDQMMKQEAPELVFHAAAYKHVPMIEANPNEGVLTNAIGTRNMADACRAHGVKAMVMISTDKAVNPSSVMGASKRLAEAYCQSLDILERRSSNRPGTRYVTVRFGNVLGSTGSVVPIFQRQLARGGPLTVTHPDMTRYFMTTREAVELVLQASVLGDGLDAGGGIFVLDMGEPVRILDLAHQMIRLAGLQPGKDVEIVYTGLRPGEKLHEDLFHDGESPIPTANKSIQLARPRTADHAVLARALDELAEAAKARRTETTLQMIQRLVPEYRGNQDERRAAGT